MSQHFVDLLDEREEQIITVLNSFIVSSHQVLQEKVVSVLIDGCGFLLQKWNQQK